MNSKLNGVLQLIDKLSENQANDIINEIYSMLKVCQEQTDASVYSLNSEEIKVCRYCGSVHIVKNGKDRHGHTRYLCRDCKRTFGSTSGSVVSRTHKDANTWQEYIKNMLLGFTLKECAFNCRISIQTAFVWRHKILNALSDSSFAPEFNGLIEMDEMYIKISYKGNHKNSKKFVMPRESYKRGSDNHHPESANRSKACVLCVAERKNLFSGFIPCRGQMNKEVLENLFNNKVSNETIVITDGFRAYKQYFPSNDIEHVVLTSNYGKPSIKGPYHINNVNALHHRFRRFLEKHNGVSTKYLNNYLSLFIWMENNKNCDRNQKMKSELCRIGSYITSVELSNFKPIPDLAPVA